MFWTNLFRKKGYFVNPFRDLFIEEFEKAGGPPPSSHSWLIDNNKDNILNSGAFAVTGRIKTNS